jgi:ParB-like chromosome segregation protein Spo0J
MIKKIEVERLKPAYYNPRVSLAEGDTDYRKLKNSIEKFGYVEPIIWNERTGNVVGGHQRLQVLKDMGEKAIEVQVVNLTEKDEKQLNLALNKIKGQWDYEKLEMLLKDFSYDEIEATGFSADEVALLFQEDEEYNYDSFEWEEETPLVGRSCVVTLKFETIEKADRWAKENGYEEQVKKGTKTTVIRYD